MDHGLPLKASRLQFSIKPKIVCFTSSIQAVYFVVVTSRRDSRPCDREPNSVFYVHRLAFVLGFSLSFPPGPPSHGGSMPATNAKRNVAGLA